jgi:hypothetical protein
MKAPPLLRQHFKSFRDTFVLGVAHLERAQKGAGIDKQRSHARFG